LGTDTTVGVGDYRYTEECGALDSISDCTRGKPTHGVLLGSRQRINRALDRIDWDGTIREGHWFGVDEIHSALLPRRRRVTGYTAACLHLSIGLLSADNERNSHENRAVKSLRV
jgi:hypothetical protein